MKRKTSLILLSGLALFSGIAVISSTLSWFSFHARMEDNPIEGSVEDEYYASGLGTSEDPFVITKPRHLYNLAWLQYLGFYNKNSGPDDHQFYFRLGDNIDMSSFGALPPIGTELNPFVGNFDGRGYVISNLTVSNNFGDYTFHPSAISSWDNETTHKQPHIMGFFGIIGQYPDGNQNSTYSTTANELKNTGLTGLTIKTVTLDSLAGIAAGYVRDSNTSDSHSVLKNIVVDNSKISLPTSGVTSSYGNDIGGNALTKISEYSLVGYTNNKSSVIKGSKQVYGINVDRNISFSATEDGNTEGWGGSIDMKSVTERLQTIQGRVNLSSFVYHKRYDYHEGVKNNTPVTVYNDNGRTLHTSLVVDRDHEEWGHFNFITDSNDDRSNYALLGGGHYETHRYYEYLQNAKISTTGPHYFTATNFQNNSATISDTNNEADAATWVVPSQNQGSATIYTTGRSGNQNRTYYLRYNNSALSLTTTAGNATTFQRSEINGKVRFTYNGYYLDYDNGWKMVRITGAPVEPTKPIPPTPPEAPILPPTPVKPKQADYFFSIGQILDGDTYLNYTGGNPAASFTSTTSPISWSFSTTLTNNGSTNIYVADGGTNRYIANTTGDSGNATFTTTQGNAMNFTAVGSNNHFRFYYTYTTTNWFWQTTYYYYLQNNNGALYLTRSAANATLDITLATEFEIKTVNIPDVAAYEAAYTAYESDLEDYTEAVNSHEAAMANYDEEYDAYLDAMHIYETVTYPNYEAQLAAFMTSSAAFEASTHKLTVTGNYSNTEYIDHETGGMNYDEDDVTYFPLSTVDNTSNFNPSDSNTAYVVAGSSIEADTQSYAARLTNVRFSKYYSTSLIADDFNVSTGKFTHIYTINDSLQKTEITNNETEYAKLKNAKDTLGKVMKGQSKTYGLHFMKSTISMDALTTAKTIKVNGKEHTNYQLPVNSIDFHLKEFGYINFVAASYYHNSETDRNDSFFSLYQIERDPVTTNISRILEVKNIYQHASRTSSYSYVYELTDGSNTFYTKPYRMVDSEGNKVWLYDTETNWQPNQYVNALPQGYAKVFNVNRIKKNNVSYSDFIDHVYFFEIPMNDGEFCLGSVEGATGSYLLYLDIGANAAKTNRTIVYEKFTLIQNTYSHPVGVALQTLPAPASISQGTAIININTTADDTDSACVEILAKATGEYVMDRSDNTVALTRANTALAPPIYAAEAITITGTDNLTPVPTDSISYDIVRMQYYDYMINTDVLSVTTFTDYYAIGSDEVLSRVIEQNRYSGNVVNDNPTDTLLYDPDGMIGTAQDDVDDMKIYNTSTGIRYDSSVVTDAGSLEIDSDRLSDTVILEFKLLQSGSDEYIDATTLVLEIDNDFSQVDTYYMFDNYTIVLTPTSGTITVKVLDYEGTFDSVIYDYDNDSSDTVTITTVITINGVPVTAINQTIPQQ